MSAARVAIAMGGRSAEREVSIRSGKAVLQALDRGRFEPLPVVLEADGSWRVGDEAPGPPEEAAARLKRAGVAVVFLALHGPGGEDGTIQGFLESVGIPYTGSRVAASALAMDKIATRHVLRAAGAAVAPAVEVDLLDWRRSQGSIEREIARLGRPVFVKAPTQGSSYGVTRVESEEPAELRAAMDGAFRYEPRALVEKGIVGIEVTASTLGNAEDPELWALPPVEIRPRRKAYFDTEEKYSKGGAEEICPPASLGAEQVRRIESLGILAHRTLRCDGMSRTDMIATPEEIFVLELNTIPGFTERSLLPQAAAAAGLSFTELVTRILGLALENAKKNR